MAEREPEPRDALVRVRYRDQWGEDCVVSATVDADDRSITCRLDEADQHGTTLDVVPALALRLLIGHTLGVGLPAETSEHPMYIEVGESRGWRCVATVR